MKTDDCGTQVEQALQPGAVESLAGSGERVGEFLDAEFRIKWRDAIARACVNFGIGPGLRMGKEIEVKRSRGTAANFCDRAPGIESIAPARIRLSMERRFTALRSTVSQK